ncbi:ubiquinol-cytochrome-c reductase complex assembly factor 6 isoform X1 [Astatotilapia calliptera]|uniref:ubiquinol-cytochrome-c reductase complex assembly factor 6 isoform X1 n=1 Tax=Astatotilapia calliptera TaxID=8154 RepID=UPI000E4114A3|nr:uncharacterized protein C12orf73 homolog isoform X1 [Astatotilapia calliptera]XP_026030921.1 uncharacterized protein C12orf73 homolog isoform X1 [Astatotilapia calliptera]
MPAGVSWARYIRMLGASVLAMFAGAQAVHQYYLPDLRPSSRMPRFRFSGHQKSEAKIQGVVFFGPEIPELVHDDEFKKKSIPDVPPKPGEFRTELQGYKVREEALKKVKSERDTG